MYLNYDLVRSTLSELTNVDYRRRLWTAQIPGSMGSLYECTVSLFGDSGLDEALGQGEVFSQAIDNRLREISDLAYSLIEAHDGGWGADQILSDPKMSRVTDLARDVLQLLKGYNKSSS